MASETLEEKKPGEESPLAEDSKLDPQKEQTESEGPKEVTENEAKEVTANEAEEEADNEEKKELEEADNEEKKEVEETEKEGAEKEESLGNDEKEGEKEEEEVGRKKAKRGSKRSSKDSAKKKEKEPVTPGSERPTRERKMVERYSSPEAGRSATKPLSIEKGRGTPLKDIPNGMQSDRFNLNFGNVKPVKVPYRCFDIGNMLLVTCFEVLTVEPIVQCILMKKKRGREKKSFGRYAVLDEVAFKLSKRKPDDNLQMLHVILFGKKGKVHNLKRNIGQFSGYVWVENEDKQKAKVREKLDKCFKEKLMDFCDVLNIPINRSAVKKEELTVKILEFLESPHATTDVLLADMEQKGKKRKVSTGKSASPVEASTTPAKKQKQKPQSGQKRKRSSKNDEDDDEDKAESPVTKDDLEEDNENEAEKKEESDHEESKSEEEEDEPKEQIPPKKVSKKSVKQSSAVKISEKATPSKKSTPAKPVKSQVKSTKNTSGSSSKKGAKDTDGSSSYVSKSKGSASKKLKVEKENPKDRSTSSKDKITGKKQSTKSPSKDTAKDQGKVKSNKKAKAEPTRQEMHAVVVNILKEVDFNTATLSDILRQLGTHFGIDLMHRKAEVKDIITDVINSMSDDEEEGEGEDADDNAEGGDDVDKDGDEDDD
ncbi:hypothetical protein SADUNF_Sadunf15G0088100 [Salix dunnii]|uniref:DEK-C domain-containing protein n=1 Tax=Salix dunnii TaxID=1413687 RepID=A0A835MP08_9ROSI|nr:hypothetical protein SADUNF_Sadunf15G0088100 [Salix dunnii]